jgi:hypothetical protein
MTAYLVVKRVTGEGSFTLDSATKNSGKLPDSILNEKSTYNSITQYSDLYSMDTNENKIHDDLEALVKNGFASDYYSTIVTFDCPLTDSIRNAIARCGGIILSSWSIINGASILIKSSDLYSLSTIPEISFITENYQSKALLSTSVPQINVRPYVWDTLGFEGDPFDAIAVMDSGFDDTHSDLSGKLTYWEDFVGHSASESGDEYATATDWNGHGTHVTSIAVGSGSAAGTASSVEITGTLGLPELSGGTGYIKHVEVESAGSVQISVQWDDKEGSTTTPSSTTTPLFGMSTANWVILGTIGLTAIILIVKKRKK